MRKPFLLLAAFLVATIAAHAQPGYNCSDRWINNAYADLYGRAPVGSGTSGECSPAVYGGSWSNYAELEAKIIRVKGPRKAAAASVLSLAVPANYTWFQSPDGTLHKNDPAKTTLAAPGTFVLRKSNGSAIPLITIAGGNIVAAGGGNIISQDGGGLVGNGPSNYRVGGTAAPGMKVFVLQ